MELQQIINIEIIHEQKKIVQEDCHSKPCNLLLLHLVNPTRYRVIFIVKYSINLAIDLSRTWSSMDLNASSLSTSLDSTRNPQASVQRRDKDISTSQLWNNNYVGTEVNHISWWYPKAV